MAWNDRIKPGAYISPSGVRVAFEVEDVETGFRKRTTAFETAGKNGTYVQDSGHGGRRLPVRAFISGPDYDLEANAFEDAIRERGQGKIEHPFYGTFDVVPFGEVRRVDKLVTAGNQAVIDVAFLETTDLFPQTQGSTGADVLESLEDFNGAMSDEFSDGLDIASAFEEVSFLDTYNTVLDNVENALQPIADTVDSVRSKFDAVKKSIDRGIDVLVKQPLALARQTLRLVQLPGQALTSITARLSAYGNLFTEIVEGFGIGEKSDFDNRPVNNFRTSDLFASATITGAVVSVLHNTFETKAEAIEAASTVLDLFDTLVVWRDDNYKSLELIDTGDSYQQLQKTVALTAGFLVELSFTLKQEKRITLTRNRSIIDLVAELYGEVDAQLDFFLNSNSLTGSEILEIPAGREVVYYV